MRFEETAPKPAGRTQQAGRHPAITEEAISAPLALHHNSQSISLHVHLSHCSQASAKRHDAHEGVTMKTL